MIFVKPYKYGVDVEIIEAVEKDVSADCRAINYYRRSGEDAAKWPKQFEVGGVVLTSEWAIPLKHFDVSYRHTNNKLDYSEFTHLLNQHHQFCVLSGLPAIRELTLEQWLDIRPLNNSRGRPSHVGLYQCKEGGTWLVQLVDKRVVMEKIETGSILSDHKVFSVDDLVEKKRESLNKSLETLGTMAEIMSTNERIYSFDIYDRKRPMRPVEFLKHLMGQE